MKERALKSTAGDLHASAYRRDIDGLRALAVCMVLFSHIGFPHSSGGYIGVDIFFVISGYLITGNISKNIQRGTFSVTEFYGRRIRRILPALFGMLIATSALVYLVLPPTDMVTFGKSAFAAIFSYSNFFFWKQSGYFAPTYTRFLLHTWSLGVEEQFYVVLPISMLLFAKTKQHARWLIAIIWAISFMLAVYYTFTDRNLAFFMPWTRAWELLCGSALALGMVPAAKSRIAREICAAVALVLILACILHFHPTSHFPGLGAVAPCVGATLLISVGEHGKTTLTSFLSWNPVVWIGVISYSLYLWHWPVAMLVRLGILPGIHEDTLVGYLFVIVVSIFFAYLSWRFVEQPFRVGIFRNITQAQLFQFAAVGSVAISAFAAFCILSQGIPNRFPPNGIRVGSYLAMPQSTRLNACFIEEKFSDFRPDLCLSKSTTKKNVLLLGDSHAAALWYGLQSTLNDVNLMQANASGCPPTKGGYNRSECSKMRQFLYEKYLPENPVDLIILTERWSSVADLNALAPALDWFETHHIPVIIVGPVPEYSAPLPLLLALSFKWNDPSLAERHRITSLQHLDTQIQAAVVQRHYETYASAWKAACPAAHCEEFADRPNDVPLLVDDNHLSNAASALVATRMKSEGELPH